MIFLLLNYRVLLILAISLGSTRYGFSSNPSTKPAFGSGEELRYILNFGIIRGGQAVLSVNEASFQGRQAYHLVASAHTSGVADRIFRVRNIYSSFIDPQTGLPFMAIRDIREGRYRYYNEVRFNHDADSTRINSQRSGQKSVRANIHDILSAFYMARNKLFNDNLQVGDVIEITTFFPDEEFPLQIRYRGIETINTRFGRVECYKFSPVTEVGRAFKTDDDMHIWITRDQNRIPVRIRFNLVVGSFTCELEEFTGLLHPFSSIQN